MGAASPRVWSGFRNALSRWRSRPTVNVWPSSVVCQREAASCRCGTWNRRPTGAVAWQPSLLLSVPITNDTLYGGCLVTGRQAHCRRMRDNSVRALDAESGQQVLFQGAHSDWVLDTVFSVDGSHLISVGRDMAAKLTEVSTERFVDNITSITPGALKGGILSVARHPTRDEIVIGGADGVPKVYRIFRQTERRIGDDANLIRRLPGLKGRVFAVAVSADGRRIAAGSSLDGSGEIAIDAYDFDTALPEDIKQINSKVATDRSADENRRLEEYYTSGLQRIALLEVPAAVYALDFHPDGKSLVVAGSTACSASWTSSVARSPGNSRWRR